MGAGTGECVRVCKGTWKGVVVGSVLAVAALRVGHSYIMVWSGV